MKKLLSILTLSATLTGCLGDGANNTPSTDNNNQNKQQPWAKIKHGFNTANTGTFFPAGTSAEGEYIEIIDGWIYSLAIKIDGVTQKAEGIGNLTKACANLMIRNKEYQLIMCKVVDNGNGIKFTIMPQKEERYFKLEPK